MKLLIFVCFFLAAGHHPRDDCRASGTLGKGRARHNKIVYQPGFGNLLPRTLTSWKSCLLKMFFSKVFEVCWDWFGFHSIHLKQFSTAKTLASIKKSFGNPEGYREMFGHNLFNTFPKLCVWGICQGLSSSCCLPSFLNVSP